VSNFKQVVARGIATTPPFPDHEKNGEAALTRYMTSQLFEVKPGDPLTFAAVAAGIVLVSILACYVLARRATEVDPMVALRYE